MAAVRKRNYKIKSDEMPILTDTEARIYEILSLNGELKPANIVNQTDLTKRSVRYTLKKLVGRGIVLQIPDFKDLRTNFYRIS